MLEKIKEIWNNWKIAIVGAVLAVVYFCGKKKGCDDEKASQNKKVLENLGRADKARRSIADNPSAVRKLHDKYKR